jgi:hypothetical protein
LALCPDRGDNRAHGDLPDLGRHREDRGQPLFRDRLGRAQGRTHPGAHGRRDHGRGADDAGSEQLRDELVLQVGKKLRARGHVIMDFIDDSAAKPKA